MAFRHADAVRVQRRIVCKEAPAILKNATIEPVYLEITWKTVMPRLVIHCTDVPAWIADCDIMMKSILADFTYKTKLAVSDGLDDAKAGSTEIFGGLTMDCLFVDPLMAFRMTF